MTQPRLREDVFVSVCFAELGRGETALWRLQRLAAQLAARFRYWELLVLVTEDTPRGQEEVLLTEVPNIRLLRGRHGLSFYHRRAAVAAEAIGDIVALAAEDELPLLDVVAMIETAAQQGTIVLGWRPQRSAATPVLGLLGRAAGFQISGEGMLTSAYPRTLLNQLLAYPERHVALRFPPSDLGIPVLRQVATGQAAPRGLRELRRRLGLIHRLLIGSAPAVLAAVALGSLLVAVTGVLYILYVVGAWLTLDATQPGWVSTNLALSLTASFLGGAVFGLSIGLQTLIEALQSDPLDDVVGERNAVDLFGAVGQELNVELDHGRPAPERPLLARPVLRGGPA